MLYIFLSTAFAMYMACIFKELLTLLSGGTWETETRQGSVLIVSPFLYCYFHVYVFKSQDFDLTFTQKKSPRYFFEDV